MQLDATMFTDDVLVHVFEGFEKDDSQVVASAVTFRIEVDAEHRAALAVRVERTAPSSLCCFSLTDVVKHNQAVNLLQFLNDFPNGKLVFQFVAYYSPVIVQRILLNVVRVDDVRSDQRHENLKLIDGFFHAILR